MRFRRLVLNLVAVIPLGIAGAAYSQRQESINAAAVNRIDLFGPVFAIMTQQAAVDSPGCRGCHIGPDAFLYWGSGPVDTAEETLQQLEQERPDLLAGGRSGTLAELLYSGGMPVGGTPWYQDELDLLDAWLMAYE